jgi:short-subunit dehydrogenase
MKDNARFANKIVIITGASSGIGRATALAFAREGATTVLVSRSEEKLQKVANEIRLFNPSTLVIPTDVSLQEKVHSMVEKVQTEYGRVDILVNNAGTAFVGPIGGERFLEDTREMMEVDFYGTVYCTKAVLPIMQRQGAGHIVNMSSVVGRKAFPHFAGYSASMHPALTQTAMLSHVSPSDMPPPFRRMTPITAESVAEAVLKAVDKKHIRVIVPSQPKRLLLADAISPRFGDRIVKMFSNPTFAYLIGIYRGNVYEHNEPFDEVVKN